MIQRGDWRLHAMVVFVVTNVVSHLLVSLLLLMFLLLLVLLVSVLLLVSLFLLTPAVNTFALASVSTVDRGNKHELLNER
jgi:hypothetical protein